MNSAESDAKKQSEAQQRYPAALRAAKRIHEGGQDGLRLAVLAEVSSPPVGDKKGPDNTQVTARNARLRQGVVRACCAALPLFIPTSSLYPS